MTRVTVIIVSYNTGALLPTCLAAYEAQDDVDLDIILVDNASTDGSRQILERERQRSRRHPLQVVYQPTNRGFSGAINDALALTDAPFVVFSNVDVIPAPDCLAIAVSALQADPYRGTVAVKLLRTVQDHGADVIDSTGHVLTTARLIQNRGAGQEDVGQWEDAGPVFGASGALSVHRRAMLDDVAWRPGEVLSEDLFAYFEDVELDWRARLLGWDAWYEPRAVARHQRGGIGPRRTVAVDALNWANRLLVIATCDDLRSLRRHALSVFATTLLKSVELTVSNPRAIRPTLARLRLLRRARRRHRKLYARARRPPETVLRTYLQPFDFWAWVATWWRRVTGTAKGIDRGR